VHHHLGAPPGICATGPFHGASGEPPERKGPEAGCDKPPVTDEAQHRTAAFERRGFNVDTAAHIAQRRVATRLKRSPDGLAQNMRQ